MAYAAVFVVVGFAAVAILSSLVYFRRVQLTRPPLGVFNLWDIAVMIGGIILVPYLYLLLPFWLVAGMLALSVLSMLYLMWEPILRGQRVIWLVVLIVMGADAGAVRWFGTASHVFLAINNGVLTLAVIGISNLWAQSGMRAHDLSLLALALAIYDGIATWGLSLMADLFSRVVGLPFAPLIAWPLEGAGPWMGIGLGDMLLAATFPLVMRKAYGRAAGGVALVMSLGTISGLLLLFPLAALLGVGVRHSVFPVMAVLGPLIVLHERYWRRRGPERTTQQYLQAEPLRMFNH